METQLFTQDQKAQYWNDLYEQPKSLFDHTMLQRRDYTVDYIEKHFDKNAKILDLGCGAGILSEQLLARGFTVTCADGSDDMLALTRERLQRFPTERYRMLRADIMNLPFDSDEFDLVVCLGVFGYFDDVDRAVAEVRRVVRPGGTFFMSVRNKYNTYFSELLHLPYRLVRFVVSRIGETLNRARIREQLRNDFHIVIRQRPGLLIEGITGRGFSLVRFDGLGFGPLKVLGKEILKPRTSMALSDAVMRVLRATGLQRAGRWLADVSFFVFRKHDAR